MLAWLSERTASDHGAQRFQPTSVSPPTPDALASAAVELNPEFAISCAAKRGGVSVGQAPAARPTTESMLAGTTIGGAALGAADAGINPQPQPRPSSTAQPAVNMRLTRL